MTDNTRGMDDREYLRLLGQNISNLRKKKGMRVIDLADECNMEKSNLIPIEKGRINATALTLLKIAKALDVDVRELFYF